jgi:hypothetical protein
MTSGIRWAGCSGSMGGQPSNRAFPNSLEIFNMQPGDTTSPLRLGFFGAGGAPNAAVIVGEYQDRTHRTNHNGSDLGVFINQKFSSSTVAIISGVTFPNMTDVPGNSGTLLCRFTEPTAQEVQTQNATFRAIAFNSSSGVPNIDSIPANITIQAFEVKNTVGGTGDGSWTDITSGSNALPLDAQAATASVHDFIVGVSASPTTTGTNRDFGFMIRLEYF